MVFSEIKALCTLKESLPSLVTVPVDSTMTFIGHLVPSK